MVKRHFKTKKRKKFFFESYKEDFLHFEVSSAKAIFIDTLIMRNADPIFFTFSHPNSTEMDDIDGSIKFRLSSLDKFQEKSAEDDERI